MEMSEEDKRIIERYARTGRVALRAAAKDAHRRYLHVPRDEWNMHMKFMGEVDNQSPDYVHRHLYRRQLLT